MNSSRENDRKRGIFDVHAGKGHELKKRFSLKNTIYGRDVINLRPNFRFRHPWAWTFGFIVLAAASFWGIRQLSSKADVQDFFPATCLGNWQNVANAEGSPETLNSSTALFSSNNSAVYASGSEIFCGGFVPPTFASSGNITNVGLTLVWQIGNAPTSTTPSIISGGGGDNISDTNTSTTATTTDGDTASSTNTTTAIPPTPTSSDASGDNSASATNTTTVATPPPTPTPAPATTPDSSTDGSSDTTSPASAPAPTPAPTPIDPSTDAGSPTSFVRELIPYALADDTSDTVPMATDTTTIVASNTALSTTSTEAVVIPDENFLDVSYSTDGQTWISIGKVNINNWQQFTVTLPINDWSDLQNLQIRVEGMPTTEQSIPPIYLDGMLVEVDYDVPSSIPSLLPQTTNNTSSTQGQTVQVSPNVTITTPPAPQNITPVPAPTISGIMKTADGVSVNVQYVGDFYDGNPLYLFVYPQGTTANRNDADSAFTFAAEPQEGPSINAREIPQNVLDPTTKQGTVTIVEPVTPDDSAIATSDMASGTYSVDISYYDGQTWHLIPAQTFTWP